MYLVLVDPAPPDLTHTHTTTDLYPMIAGIPVAMQRPIGITVVTMRMVTTLTQRSLYYVQRPLRGAPGLGWLSRIGRLGHAVRHW